MSHEPPRSTRYADTYYSAEDGWAESRHVFVDGNDLGARFAALGEGEVFVIGELGFGTGLNVAAAMDAFARRGHARGQLAVFTVEGHPLSPAAFGAHAEAAAERWPEAAAPLRALTATYPEPLDGFVRVRPAPGVDLTIGFGEASDVLARAQVRADAWFLDGFSPATNPAMWSPDVLAAVARSSRPGAAAATFTVAGAVRRGLAAAGFEVAKASGFGTKREMLTARLTTAATAAASVPSPPAVLGQSGVLDDPPGGPVAVLGAGIAGACAAWHLRRAGQAVTVFDPNGPAHGASGNPGGLITPRIEAADNVAARFYRDAYLFALRFYEETAPEGFAATGAVIRMAPDRAAKVLATGIWPNDVLRPHEDGLFAPGAGVLRPGFVVRALLGEGAVRGGGALSGNAKSGWSVDGGRFASVVVASPSVAQTIDWGAGPGLLSGHRGQIDVFAHEGAPTITGDGYVSALPWHPAGAVMAGAPYARAELDDVGVPTDADTGTNEATAKRLADAPGALLMRRASVRAATPDRHPLAGPVPDIAALDVSHAGLRHGQPAAGEPSVRRGLFVLSGLGSRGLVTAPLCAAAVADLVVGAPCPLTVETSAWLHPARFAVRAMKRKER